MQSERASLLLPGQLCASSFHNIPSTLMISLSPQDGRPHFLPDHHNDVHLRCPHHTSAALNSRCHVPCLFKVRGSISLLRGCMLESSSQLSHLQRLCACSPRQKELCCGAHASPSPTLCCCLCSLFPYLMVLKDLAILPTISQRPSESGSSHLLRIPPGLELLLFPPFLRVSCLGFGF